MSTPHWGEQTSGFETSKTRTAERKVSGFGEINSRPQLSQRSNTTTLKLRQRERERERGCSCGRRSLNWSLNWMKKADKRAASARDSLARQSLRTGRKAFSLLTQPRSTATHPARTAMLSSWYIAIRQRTLELRTALPDEHTQHYGTEWLLGEQDWLWN